jgi:hypothetical protein
VSNHDISVPLAAGGLVAKFVNCLRAKRAGDFVRDYRDSKAVRDCSTKNLRLQDSVDSVLKRGDCGHPGAGVRLDDPHQPLLLASVGCSLNQISVYLLVNLEGGSLLTAGGKGQDAGRDRPRLSALRHSLEKTRCVGCVCVFGSAANPKPTEGGGEASLTIGGIIIEGEA